MHLLADNPLFKIVTPEAFAGVKVPAAGQYATPIAVTYVPGIVDGSDHLVVESSGGSATIELHGGSPPSVRTSPATILDFGPGLTHDPHELPLTVNNVKKYNQQLDLTIQDMVMADPNSVFTVVRSGDLPMSERIAVSM